MPIVVESWSPYVYGTPEDRTEHYRQYGMSQWAGVYAVVSKDSGDGEMFWNGSTFEPFNSANYASYVIPGTSPRQLHWDVPIPWSLIGGGFYNVRACILSGPPGHPPSPSNRVFTNGKPVSRHIIGPRSPNPDGIVVSSNYGGPNALRVVDGNGNGIAGVEVVATVMPDGNNEVFERGKATSGSDGHWSFDRVLEPLTEHRIDCTKNGFTFPRQIITTGASS